MSFKDLNLPNERFTTIVPSTDSEVNEYAKFIAEEIYDIINFDKQTNGTVFSLAINKTNTCMIQLMVSFHPLDLSDRDRIAFIKGKLIEFVTDISIHYKISGFTTEFDKPHFKITFQIKR